MNGAASLDLRQHREAADTLITIGVEERIMILERYAAVGLTARPEQIGVCEQSVPAEDLLLAANRRQPQHWHAVKQCFTRLQFVDMRRRHALHPHVRITDVIHLRAESRTRLSALKAKRPGAFRDLIADLIWYSWVGFSMSALSARPPENDGCADQAY